MAKKKEKKACGCRSKCPQVAHCRTCKEPTFYMADACHQCKMSQKN